MKGRVHKNVLFGLAMSLEINGQHRLHTSSLIHYCMALVNYSIHSFTI